MKFEKLYTEIYGDNHSLDTAAKHHFKIGWFAAQKTIKQLLNKSNIDKNSIDIKFIKEEIEKLK